MQENIMVRVICPNVLDSKGWERPLASGCGSKWWVWKRWVVQEIKHQLRSRALWALLCPCYPGMIVAESLQGLIFVDIHQNR